VNLDSKVQTARLVSSVTKSHWKFRSSDFPTAISSDSKNGQSLSIKQAQLLSPEVSEKFGNPLNIEQLVDSAKDVGKCTHLSEETFIKERYPKLRVAATIKRSSSLPI